ncbi:MAG: PPC domain-containing protein [Chloroflexi bacterium]|nr:PPC domain-containing protein [Chloroflexota bacterium]
MRLFALLLFIFIIHFPAAAQDDPAALLVYGQSVSGQINNSTPRAVYAFDGLRGEVLAISVTATGGSLDPVLSLQDASGQVLFNLDDSQGSRDITIEALRVPQSGRYTLVVGRFGYRLGSTSGDYNLRLERIGVSSASGSALRYGDSVINTISNMTPQLFYSFRARRGEIVNIRMERVSGNLDPYLQVVDSNAFLLADNDDVPGTGSLDATITGLLIERDGTYVIKATRYGEAAGTSTGRFVLTLQEADDSGLGNSAQAAIPINLGDTVQGEITADDINRYYAFEAKANDLITVRMTRLTGSLDSFLILANAGLQQLSADDDSGGGQNAKIENFLVPADGLYYLIASRFDGDTGTTTGSYRLELQSLGSAFEDVPEDVQRISYGTTVTGRIDDQTPEVTFAFWGFQGDAISIALNRGDGDLDPAVRLLDADGSLLASDDDSGGGQNARIARYVLPRSGPYTIRATRFSGADGNPNTQGSFILVLARVFE